MRKNRYAVYKPVAPKTTCKTMNTPKKTRKVTMTATKFSIRDLLAYFSASVMSSVGPSRDSLDYRYKEKYMKKYQCYHDYKKLSLSS